MIRIAGRLCVILVVFLSPWATYTQFGFFLTPITLVGGLLLAFYMADRISLGDSRIRLSSLYLAGYTLLILLSYVWSGEITSWKNFIPWWFICLSCYLGTRRFILTKAHLTSVMVAAAASMIPTYFSLGAVEFEYATTDRLAVTGHNSNFTSYVIAGAFLIIAMPWRLLKFSPRIYLLLAPALLLSFSLVSLLGTRGAAISLLSILTTLIMDRIFPQLVVKTFLLSVVVLSILTTFGQLDALLTVIDLQSSRSTGDLSGRGHLWQLAIEKFNSSPLIGSGFGASSKLGDEQAGAHNFFLIILADTGLLGMSMMTAFIISWSRDILRNTKDGVRILLFFAAYWFPIATSGHWELAPFSWLMVGLTAQISQMKQVSDKKSVVAGEYKPPKPLVALAPNRRDSSV